MAEPEQQATQPKREFLAVLSPWAETFSKAVAGIAIALYACGFLIVSLHHSKFGFVGTNPFRPRVLAAGAWFFFFAGIPASFAASYRPKSWLKIARDSAALWVGSYSTSILLGYLLFDFSTPSVDHMPLSLWLGFVLFAAWLALVVAVNYSKVPNWLATAASVLLTAFYVAEPTRTLLVKHEFVMSSIALWFFACSVVAIVEFKIRNPRNLVADAEWAKMLGVLFVALLAFAQYVYPHLKASWGGGTPANVTIYFTKDSLLGPGKAVQAQLIEEADEGFYIVGPKESKAIFVPRSSVALIYFSDKWADSPMLQGNK